MITGKEIDSILEMLSRLPELPDDERLHSNKEAVKRLAPVISELREKGYTLEQIAGYLADTPLTIKPSTLKTYLAPEKPTNNSKKAPAKRKSRRKPPVAVTAPKSTAPKTSETTAPPESSTFKVADDRPIGEL